MEYFIKEYTLPEAYHKALLAVNEQAISPCPDYNTTQKECAMTFVVMRPLEEPMISKLIYGDPRSLEQYRQEMLDGVMDWAVLARKLKYTYHERYTAQKKYIGFGDTLTVNQYRFVIDELKRNPYSRRAVMDIRTLDDIRSNDPACWQHTQYLIRDGKLHCKVLFRSNDAVKAAFQNAFALIMLQKRIADELGVEMGTYTHRANSFHCYERDYKLLEGYVRRYDRAYGDPYKSCPEKEVSCKYKGEWDELMEEERLSIAKMIEGAKRR